MLKAYQDYYGNYNSYAYNYDRVETQTAFALKISVGGKFVPKGGFTTEVLLGVGRNLIKEISNDNYDFYQKKYWPFWNFFRLPILVKFKK
jgi:hypothetical protein